MMKIVQVVHTEERRRRKKTIIIIIIIRLLLFTGFLPFMNKDVYTKLRVSVF